MLLSIDEKDSRPIYQQLISQIKEQVGKEILKPGDELPSVRELSDSLKINMHTARRAFLLLRDQGIIDMRLGRRARVSHKKPSTPLAKDRLHLQARLKELLTDALLLGLSPEEVKEMVSRELK
jgi:GntR family transcriptional regulator